MAGEESPFVTAPETMALDEVAEVLENHLGSTRTAYEEIIRELLRAVESAQQDPTGSSDSLHAVSLELEEIAREVFERGGSAWQDLQNRILDISKRLAEGGR